MFLNRIFHVSTISSTFTWTMAKFDSLLCIQYDNADRCFKSCSIVTRNDTIQPHGKPAEGALHAYTLTDVISYCDTDLVSSAKCAGGLYHSINSNTKETQALRFVVPKAPSASWKLADGSLHACSNRWNFLL